MNLTAKLILDDKEYTVQLQEAKQKAENTGKGIGKSALGAKLGWVAVGTAIAGVIKKMGELMYNTTEYAGSIKDLAQVYETTYQNVQELNYLAQESGKNAEWVLRKARSSGESYAEVLGLSNEEYLEMIANAKEMGIILEDEIIDRADMLGDQISQLKYQWQAVLTNLLAGNENADELLSQFFNRVGAFMEQNLPIAIQFIYRLLMQLAMAIVRIAPKIISSLITELIDLIIEFIMSGDWFKVGWNVAIAILEGVINGLLKAGGGILDMIGIKIPEVDFSSAQMELTTGKNYNAEYSYSTNNSSNSNVTNNTTITIEAKDANAREIANEVSRILSTQIQAKGR